MLLLHLFFVSISLWTLAHASSLFPIVDASIRQTILNIQKVFAINGDLSKQLSFMAVDRDTQLHWEDLVQLANSQLETAIMIKTLKKLSMENNIAFQLVVYNTLSDKFEHDDAAVQRILENQYGIQLTAVLAGTIIKDEYGVEKMVLNAIYLIDCIQNCTHLLEFDMHYYALQQLSQKILARAPKQEIPDKVQKFLQEVYTRNEQLMQLFLQIALDSFSNDPYHLFPALIGNWLLGIDHEFLSSFHVQLHSPKIKDYFPMNWAYLVEYHEQLLRDPNHIQLNEALFKALGTFSDIDNNIKQALEGILRLKNYWEKRATGLNSVIQALIHNEYFTQQIIWSHFDKTYNHTHEDSLIKHFHELISDASVAANSLTTKDTTRIFDYLAKKYDTLYNTEYGYDLYKLLLVILKEIALEIVDFSSGTIKYFPNLLVRGTAVVNEHCSQTGLVKNSFIEFECLTLNIHQFHSKGIFQIGYFLENSLFGFKSSNEIFAGNCGNVCHDECPMREIKLIKFPHILLIVVEEGALVDCQVDKHITLHPVDGQYSLSAVVGTNRSEASCAHIPIAQCNTVAEVSDEFVALNETIDTFVIAKAYIIVYELHNVE